MYADVRCHQDRVHTLIGAPLGRFCRILWACCLQRCQWGRKYHQQWARGAMRVNCRKQVGAGEESHVEEVRRFCPLIKILSWSYTSNFGYKSFLRGRTSRPGGTSSTFLCCMLYSSSIIRSIQYIQVERELNVTSGGLHLPSSSGHTVFLHLGTMPCCLFAD